MTNQSKFILTHINPFLWRTALVMYVALLSFVSLKDMTKQGAPSTTEQMIHNSFHIPAYFILCMLALIVIRITFQKSSLYALAGSFLFGTLMEFLQSLTGYRTASMSDIILNALGCLVAYALFQQYLLPKMDDIKGENRRS